MIWGGERTYKQLEKEVNDSNNGFFITWDGLNALAQKFYQVIWITIIGCKDEEFLRNYENDQEMYASCDLVIAMIDGWFLEIFAKDENLIDRLAKKINKMELIESDSKINAE